MSVTVNNLIFSPKKAKVTNSLETTVENYRLTSMLMLYLILTSKLKARKP